MARRHSKKGAASKSAKRAIDTEDEAYSPADDEDQEAPVERTRPKKKARTTTSRVKGRRGVLSAFSWLPLDLVYEICSNLDPRDLFALSTTSKAFRSVVTGNLAAGLWKEARERVGLPELELPMTDLQYAHLLFGKGCSFCTRKNAGKPDTFYRARICTACLRDHFATNSTGTGNNNISEAVNHKLHPLTLFVVKFTNPYARFGGQYRLEDVKKVNSDIVEKFADALDKSSDDRTFVTLRGGPARGPGQWLIAPVDGTLEPKTPFQQWWIDNCEQPRGARIADGNKLRDWLAEQDRNKSMSQIDKRTARREELERRFKEEGFVDKEFESREWWSHSLVRKPDILTERMWPNVEGTLRAKLLANRASRHHSTLTTHIHSMRYDTVAKDERSLVAYYPHDSIAAMVPAFRAVVDDVSTYVAPAQLWELNKDAILDELDDLVRSRIEEMLRALAVAHADLRTADGDQDSAIDGLNASMVELPRLPSFIPRKADRPLVASDAQLVAFLQEHPLSIFSCALCDDVYTGDAALKHVGSPYCRPEVRETAELGTWARCSQPTSNSIAVDKTIVMRALYLRQLYDGVDLAPPANMQHLEKQAAKYDVELDDAEKFRKKWECSCPHFHVKQSAYPAYAASLYPQSAYPAYPASLYPIPEIFRHIRENHASEDRPAAKLRFLVEYTPMFTHAVRRAKYLAERITARRDRDALSGVYDSVGYDFLDDMHGEGYGRSGYYSPDVPDSEFEAMRDDCTIM
ncbi:hypothetical protein JCM3770_006586 [Rhodotorula araucariae]